MQDLIQCFLDYLKSEKNDSPLTVVSYENDLRHFEEFFVSLGEDITWLEMTDSVVREWIVYLLDQENMAPSSVNRKLSALRTFYHYLKRMGKIEVNPMLKVVGPKKHKVLPAFIQEKDMDRLLELMQEDESLSGVRDRLIVLMFYLTGMRRAELISLRDCDVDFVNKQIKVTGKRNKQRLIPFGEELEAELKKYLELRDAEAGGKVDSFFVNDKGLAITEGQVGKIVKDNLTKVTTQKKRSPHVLRHTFATSMLNHDADLVSIQKLLGHSNLKTTEVYTHLSFEELKKVYQNAHPRS